MNKEELVEFLFKARTATTAKAGGQVEPALPGTEQAEFTEGDFLYRDVYYNGKNSFSGIEGVFYQDKAVWACSYWGKSEVAWNELDEVLRKVQRSHPDTMGWKYVEAEIDDFKYVCSPDVKVGIDEIGGTETISKDGKQVYYFYYAGSLLNG